MDERFEYQASAVALTASLTLPYSTVAPPQAILGLDPAGGLMSTGVRDFDFHGVVSFKSAMTIVSGSPSNGYYDSLASTAIEGFDCLGIVTADRIVSRLAARHPMNGGLVEIDPIGSHFDNLRIAGHRIDVDLAIDTFSRLSTAHGVRQAYRENSEGFRDEFHQLTLVGSVENIIERIEKYLPWRRHEATADIPENEGTIRLGLVRELAGLSPKLSRHGHVIHIPGFGVIRLAELFVNDYSRGLTMIHIDLGSTPAGQTSSGSTSSGSNKKHGTGWGG